MLTKLPYELKTLNCIVCVLNPDLIHMCILNLEVIQSTNTRNTSKIKNSLLDRRAHV